MLYSLDINVLTFAGITSSKYLSLAKLKSNMVTSAPRPAAIFAALVPTTPPPSIITFAGLTPGTPPKSMPRPPEGFSKYLAPSWMAIRPATSDIGTKSGNDLSVFSTVS